MLNIKHVIKLQASKYFSPFINQEYFFKNITTSVEIQQGMCEHRSYPLPSTCQLTILKEGFIVHHFFFF